MANETPQLLGIVALRRYLKSRIGEVDIDELRRLADDGLIPAVRLRSARKGRPCVYGFCPEAVEQALAQLARQLPEKGGER